MRRPSTLATAGFTLIELFVATAILGVAMIYLLDGLTMAPDRANRAKLRSVAALLARAKVSEVESQLFKEGWEDFAAEDCGDFKDDEWGGLSRYRWCVNIDKIELPGDINTEGLVGKMLGLGDGEEGGAAGASGAPGLSSLLGGMGGGLLSAWMGGGQAANTGASGTGATGAANAPTMDTGGLTGLLTSFLNPFKNVVEQAIRRITVTVFWRYRRKEDRVVIIYYVTRPDLVDQAIVGGFMSGMMGGQPGQPGQTGTTGKSGSSSGKGGTK
jgi:general secretion pathway protein I